MDAVQAFLQAHTLVSPAFAPGSRYHGIATSQLVQADGTTVVFVQRRFLPPPEAFAPLQVVTVVSGERLDHLAARHLGDAQQWWRLADANRAMQPEALVAHSGATLTVTLPEGVPAPGGNDGL